MENFLVSQTQSIHAIHKKGYQLSAPSQCQKIIENDI